MFKRHENYSCQHIVGQQMQGIDASNSHFTESLLRNCLLHNCSFEYANMDKVNIMQSTFTLVDFKNAYLWGANFSDTKLQACRFSGCMNNVTFENCDLNSTVISGVVRGCDFKNCDFANVELDGAMFYNSTFENCKNITGIAVLGQDKIYVVRHGEGVKLLRGEFWGTLAELQESVELDGVTLAILDLLIESDF